MAVGKGIWVRLNQQLNIVGGKEFKGWCKGTCWDMSLLRKEIQRSAFILTSI